MRRIVVAGASRGLGAVIAHHYVAAGDDVIALSRTPSASGDWIACDLADSEAITRVAGTIAGAVDVLIFVAGIWEAEAFSDDYSFAGSSSEEISRVIAVNLQAPIQLSKALLPQLVAAGSARIVLIGSTSGSTILARQRLLITPPRPGCAGRPKRWHRRWLCRDCLCRSSIPVILGPTMCLMQKRAAACGPEAICQ